MARSARLTFRGLVAPAVVIVVAVLIAHGLVLEWLASRAGNGGLLPQMATPLFTRLLTPTDPVAPAVPAAVAAAPATSPGRLSVNPSVPPRVAAAASKAAARPAPVAKSPPENSAASAPDPAESPPPAVVAPPAEPAAATLTPPLAPAPAASALPATASSPQTDAPVRATTAPPPASPALDGWPTDTRLSYRLDGQFRGGPLYGNARVQWQRQGALYQAQVDIDLKLLGQRTLTSQGEVTPQGLVPRAYEERSGSRRRSVRLENAQVVLHDGRTLPRPADVQDTASQFVELGHRFSSGRQVLAVGGLVEVWLARPGGVDRWVYDVLAQERLKTPGLGEVLAWRLRPQPQAQRRDGPHAEVWLAPSLQYLPVRIRLKLGEEAEIDLLVETIEQR